MPLRLTLSEHPTAKGSQPFHLTGRAATFAGPNMALRAFDMRQFRPIAPPLSSLKISMEATMTEGESLYLALCIAMFGVFAFSLAYTTWSWERWQSRAVANKRQPAETQQPEARLAA